MFPLSFSANPSVRMGSFSPTLQHPHTRAPHLATKSHHTLDPSRSFSAVLVHHGHPLLRGSEASAFQRRASPFMRARPDSCHPARVSALFSVEASPVSPVPARAAALPFALAFAFVLPCSTSAAVLSASALRMASICRSMSATRFGLGGPCCPPLRSSRCCTEKSNETHLGVPLSWGCGPDAWLHPRRDHLCIFSHLGRWSSDLATSLLVRRPVLFLASPASLISDGRVILLPLIRHSPKPREALNFDL